MVSEYYVVEQVVISGLNVFLYLGGNERDMGAYSSYDRVLNVAGILSISIRKVKWIKEVFVPN